MLYSVYILRCQDDSYYTGVTNDVKRRVWEHQNGLLKGCYTRGRRPVALVYTASFNNVLDAIEFEKQIKGWSRKKKEALIEGRYDELPGLAKGN